LPLQPHTFGANRKFVPATVLPILLQRQVPGQLAVGHERREFGRQLSFDAAVANGNYLRLRS
jgi:hypothetical protein